MHGSLVEPVDTFYPYSHYFVLNIGQTQAGDSVFLPEGGVGMCWTSCANINLLWRYAMIATGLVTVQEIPYIKAVGLGLTPPKP